MIGRIVRPAHIGIQFLDHAYRPGMDRRVDDAMLLGDGGAHRASIDDYLLGREGEMAQGKPGQSEDDQNDAYKGQGFHHAPSGGGEMLHLTRELSSDSTTRAR